MSINNRFIALPFPTLNHSDAYGGLILAATWLPILVVDAVVVPVLCAPSEATVART